jgi:hypothetical protein
MEFEKLIKMEFEKKYVIVGEIFFNNQDAEIVSVSNEKMIYTKDSFEKFMNKIEDDGVDYIVLPDYKFPFMAINKGCLENVERIKKMAKDIGWGEY